MAKRAVNPDKPHAFRAAQVTWQGEVVRKSLFYRPDRDAPPCRVCGGSEFSPVHLAASS